MSVEGTYSFAANSVMGVFEGKSTLTCLDDGVLKGTIEVMDDEVELENGTYDGNSFAGACVVKGPMGKMKLKISGTVEGDAISGSLDAGLIKMSFEGTRA